MFIQNYNQISLMTVFESHFSYLLLKTIYKYKNKAEARANELFYMLPMAMNEGIIEANGEYLLLAKLFRSNYRKELYQSIQIETVNWITETMAFLWEMVFDQFVDLFK